MGKFRLRVRFRKRDIILDYDPHLFRYITHPITNTEAFISILRCSIGTGCLEMPRAFCNSGWVNGFIGTFAIGGIMIYSINILILAMYDICKREKQSHLTYPECMRIALEEGPAFLRPLAFCAAPFVNFFLSLYHFGVCCVYVLFIADNLKQLGDKHFTGELNFHLYIMALTGPLVAIFSIRKFKNLVPFAFFANVFLFLGLLFIMGNIIPELPSLSERSKFTSLSTYPLFFGTVLFAMESVGVILAIERELENPKDYIGFTGIMAMGTIIALCVYSIFGFIGYWRFGCDVYGNISLNIAAYSTVSEVSKLLMALAIYFSYALQGYVIVEVIWHQYLSEYFYLEEHIITEYALRCILVLFTVFGAAVSPDISIFLPLVGAFCLTILSLVLPCLMDLCVNYKYGYGPGHVILVRDLVIMGIGILGCISGTWVSTANFNREFSELDSRNRTLFFYSPYL